MNRIRSIFASLLLVAALMVSIKADGRAQSISVIDFEGMSEGAIVDSVSSGNGVSGDAVSGEVYVYGENPFPWITTNAAMIFDATCTPGGTPADCSGADDDLYHPEWGNILIISEDLDSADPDDAVGLTLSQSDWKGGQRTQIVATLAWHENKGGSLTPSDHAKALRSGASHSYQEVGVRRLTPVECERLQLFPDS